MLVRVKSWNELKETDWMADEMRIHCGRTYKVLCEVDDKFVCLAGCGDWQFGKDGLEVLSM